MERVELPAPLSRTLGLRKLAVRVTAPRSTGSNPRSDSPAVVLIHGTPGGADNFAAVSDALAAEGWLVLCPDTPGSGLSVDPAKGTVSDHRYSLAADAILHALDALRIPRAHVVGWSSGGAVALHMAHAAPQRFASLTLHGGIGPQRTEGSGSYAIERIKYALGMLLLVHLPEAVPHFGLLPSRSFRLSSIRPFWDSDQRPLEAVMRHLRTPTLILHGRHDFLVSWRAAEVHHAIMPASKLVMLDADHFMPFLAPLALARELGLWFDAVDTDTWQQLAERRIDAPPSNPMGPWQHALEQRLYPMHWLAKLAIAAGLTALSPMLALAVLATLIARGVFDILVVIMGVWVGLLARGRQRDPTLAPLPWPPRAPARAVAMLAHASRTLAKATAVVLLARALCFALVVWLMPRLAGHPLEAPVFVLASLAAACVAFALPMLATQRLRQRLLARVGRMHHEFWPTWLFYLVPAAWILMLAPRRGGIATLTCANPGVGPGGGIIGESKIHILRALGSEGQQSSDHLLPFVAVLKNNDQPARIRDAAHAIDTTPALGGYPIAAKPDSGFKAFGFRVLRSHDDLAGYIARMPRDFILQRYHPGPHECAIMWARAPGATAADSTVGSITNAVRKVFPFVLGDGRRTLEALVYAHPRYRMQAGLFLRRLGSRRTTVPAAGASVRLAIAGNHAQGTLFLDGTDLITPALTRAIDRIAATMPSPQPGDAKGGLDIGRFDIRYVSDEALRRGEDFAIVELNGSTAEPTNMYDPRRSVLWAYRVMLGHVRLFYDLAAHRRREGVRPMSLAQLRAAWRSHHSDRPDMAVSD